jgi:hypothetical protein
MTAKSELALLAFIAAVLVILIATGGASGFTFDGGPV